MYSLIMFDMDGTLVNSVSGLVKTLNDTAEHFGMKKYDEQEIVKLIGPKLYETFHKTIGKSHEEAMAMTEWFRRDYEDKHIFDATVYPGIKELLVTLKKKGFKTAIVTNKRYDYAESIAEHFGLSDYFDGIYGMDFESTLEKHQLIERCLRELNTDRKDAVLVGDTLSDKNAAQIANIDFIPVSYGFGKWECDACDDTDELLIHLTH